MKNNTTNKNRFETQIRRGIKDAEAVKLLFCQKGKTNGPEVRNHLTFGAAGGRYCTGPPGRARSPGILPDKIPDHPPNGCDVLTPDREIPIVIGTVRGGPETKYVLSVGQMSETYYHTEYQRIINNKPNFKFITNIKFLKIMKKQILLLAFFVLAMMAGSLSSFGQALNPGITATQPIVPIDCATNATALNPVPGVPFTYAMDNGTAAKSANWTWWATKDPDFMKITAPATTPDINLGTQLTVVSNALLTGTSVNYGADNRAAGTVLIPAGSPSVTIEWSAAILSATTYRGDGVAPNGTPTFVVGYSEGDAYCTDNIQVFEINPQPNFTIDIAAIDAAGATLNWGIDTEERCVDNVQSAIYKAVDGTLDMDYGTNTIYYEVAAANFNTNFTPQFRVLGGLLTTQTAVISIYESYADATAAVPVTPLWSSATIVAADATAATYKDFRADLGLTAANAPDVATGVSFYVKVLIDNNTQESLLDNPFVLAVDGEDNVIAATGIANTTSIWDMEDEDCGATPNLLADQVDNSTITVTSRPTLIMTPNPATTGEPGGATPDNYIIKNP